MNKLGFCRPIKKGGNDSTLILKLLCYNCSQLIAFYFYYLLCEQ